jgi:predicted transcriptional regulator
MFLKMENAIYTKEMERDKLNESKNELNKNIERMQESEIVIRNTLYEGVGMDINAIRWNSKELKSVAIKKSGRRVVVDSL